MKKTALGAISTTTTIAVSVIIAAALIALPIASTSKVAFAVEYTKKHFQYNRSNHSQSSFFLP